MDSDLRRQTGRVLIETNASISTNYCLLKQFAAAQQKIICKLVHTRLPIVIDHEEESKNQRGHGN